MPTILISPKPPQQGQPMTVTVIGASPPLTVYFNWDPAGTPTSAETNSDGSVTITVPSNATSVSGSGG